MGIFEALKEPIRLGMADANYGFIYAKSIQSISEKPPTCGAALDGDSRRRSAGTGSGNQFRPGPGARAFAGPDGSPPDPYLAQVYRGKPEFPLFSAGGSLDRFAQIISASGEPPPGLAGSIYPRRRPLERRAGESASENSFGNRNCASGTAYRSTTKRPL